MSQSAGGSNSASIHHAEWQRQFDQRFLKNTRFDSKQKTAIKKK